MRYVIRRVIVILILLLLGATCLILSHVKASTKEPKTTCGSVHIRYVSTKNTIRMYQKPSTKSKSTNLHNGNRLKYTTYNKNWIKVQTGGKSGFVQKKHLSQTSPEKPKYSAQYFTQMGVLHWSKWTWTWYSQRVLPGGGLKIPGRHVDSNGYICDKDDLICVASSVLKKGTVLKTPFGKRAKVYDTGCNPNIIDVYVDW